MKKLSMDELNRISVEEFKNKKKTSIVIVLDNVRSLHNVAPFRTADAFQVEKIYLCGITGTPPNREINKTALGATESVAWEYVDQAIHIFPGYREKKYQIIALEQTNQSIPLQEFQIEPTGSYVLIFGNEVFGVKEEVLEQCDQALEIPQFGTKHSFNVSVTGGIVLWEFFRKMHF